MGASLHLKPHARVAKVDLVARLQLHAAAAARRVEAAVAEDAGAVLAHAIIEAKSAAGCFVNDVGVLARNGRFLVIESGVVASRRRRERQRGLTVMREGFTWPFAADAKLKPEAWMRFPESPYINQEDGDLRIAGTRVGLDTIVDYYQHRRTPEQIVHSFPTVTLAQVYGAIAYYLENKQLIDEDIAEVKREFEKMVRPLSETNPELFARLKEAYHQLGSKRT